MEETKNLSHQVDNSVLSESTEILLNSPFEDQPLSHSLLVARNFDFRPHLKRGEFFDVLDTLNKWCLAEVVDTAEGSWVRVHYDNWSKKYDEVSSTHSRS